MINENVIKGQWKQIKGALQKKWGDLTDDELDRVQGDYNALEGLMQKKLGLQQENARQELNNFFEKWSSPSSQTESDPQRNI